MPDSKGSVLVVDDDLALGKVLVGLLRSLGYAAEHVPSAAGALGHLERRPFDAVLSDLRMPGTDGMALLGTIRNRWPAVPVLLLTAYGSIQGAVEAMQAGASTFLVKPCEKEELDFELGKALSSTRSLRERVPEAPAGAALIGDSPRMRELRSQIAKAGAGKSTILLRGETGTGKELVAKALHDASMERRGPFVPVNCGALAETLLESELFGHEKGAFSGAVTRKPGRVELAHKGTLFLDEVGEMSPSMQTKMLRVLDYKEVQRVGGTETVKVDVRFIAATHRDLAARVASGEFRQDLFFRLDVVTIEMPPLRERREDVEPIARHYCATFGREMDAPHIRFADAAFPVLAAYAWPGNVRELKNLVERLVAMRDGDVIGPADVERELARRPLGGGSSSAAPRGSSLPERRRDAEYETIMDALKRCHGNRTKAASVLQISRSTLYNKLREYGLE